VLTVKPIFSDLTTHGTTSADYFPEVINDDDNGSNTVRLGDGALPGIPPVFSSEVLGSGWFR
jgi:hypothetical protein